MKSLILLLMLILVLLASASHAQETSIMVTYGAQAPTREGDNDFIQVIYIELPQSLTDTVYLRIYDADCGGSLDSRYGEYDTETRFTLYGGMGAFSAPTAKNVTPSEKDRRAGIVIKCEKFGIDNFRDNQWYNFAAFTALQGEEIGGKRFFKLLVEGLGGNDGNLFDLTVSLNPKRNLPPEGLKIYNYAPTIRLPETGVLAEMRFFVPHNLLRLKVYNFDLAGASMGVETAFRSNLPVASSEQDAWAESEITLEVNETNRLCALTFKGGREIPNDATFYVLDQNGSALPIQLPIYIRKENNRPLPKVDFKALSDPLTIVFDAAGSYDLDGEAMDFFWDFGDDQTGGGERVTHKYSSAGTYEALLIVSDASGQVGNSTMKRFIIIVNHPPQAEAGPDLTGAPGQWLEFDASKSLDPDGAIIKYSWDFGDGVKAEGKRTTHKYRRTGYYNVILTVEDDSRSPNNTARDELEVWINSPPVVELGDDIVCSPRQTINLNGRQSFDADGDIVEFAWDLGDGDYKNGIEIGHAYARPGKYKVRLTVKDNAAAINSLHSDSITVTVNDAPVAKIITDKVVVAVEEKIRFDGRSSTDSDGKIIDYRWNFGDASTGEGSVISHSYKSPGRYDVALTVKDNSTTTTELDDEFITIIVNFPPVTDAGPDQLVTTSEVKFDGTKSSDRDGKITEYLWEFGDGSTSNEPAPVHSYGNPGVYRVKLTVTDDAKTSTSKTSDELTVTVNYAPVADAGPDQIGWPGQEMFFDGSESMDFDGEIVEYSWDFGDGNTAVGESVSHIYTKPGTYSVTLKVRDNTRHQKALGVDEVRIYINAPPVSRAGQDKIAAPGDRITFDGSGSFDPDGKIDSYKWEFSDGEAASDKVKTTRIFKEPGIYTAELTVIDNSGAQNNYARDKVSIKVNHQPEAVAVPSILTNKLSVELDGSASSDADGDKLSYIWDFGDGSPSKFGAKVAHMYKKGGLYPAILTVDDGMGLSNSRHSTSVTVQVNEAPVADAGEDTTVCAGDVVIFNGGKSFDPEAGVLKYLWNFGDGTNAEGINATKTFIKGGVYQVTLLVTDDSGLPGNEDIDQIIVRVAESPVADAGPDQNAGVNQEVHFDGANSTDLDGLVNSYFWDFGDGGTGGGPTPIHVFTTPGVYRVTLVITGDKIGECSNQDSDEMTVTVYDAPAAVFECEKIVPQGTEVKFDASKSESRMAKIADWSWDFGDGSTGAGDKTSHRYNSAGKYIVSLKVATDSKTEYNSALAKQLIVVNASPTADAGGGKFTGINQTALFQGGGSKDPDGAITSYHWDFGDGSTAEGIQVRHQYTASGSYTVTLKVVDDTELKNNWASDTAAVTVNESPVAVIGCRQSVSIGDSVRFSGAESKDTDGRIARYTWYFSDGTAKEGAEVVHIFNYPGVYQATLTVDDGASVINSRADTSVNIKVNLPPKADAGPDRLVSAEEKVNFDGSGSRDEDGKLIAYHWDFGDGKQAEGLKVTHSYDKPGTYQARLTITDDSQTRTAAVSDDAKVRVNAPPVAVAGEDVQAFCGGAHDDVVFDGSKSHDPDGDPLSFGWIFGDGNAAEGPVVTHKYLKPGIYEVKLIVSDNTGTTTEKSEDTITVSVRKRGQ